MRMMGLGNTNLSNHLPNEVESSCERLMMPGGLGAARGEYKNKHTNTPYSKIKLQKYKPVHFHHSTEQQAFSSHKLHAVVIHYRLTR